MSFHSEVLQGAQADVLGMLAQSVAEAGFYLTGGTALALHLGHRRSEDFDWFTQDSLPDPLVLAQHLRDAGIPFMTTSTERGTLHGTVAGVRVTFLEYRYPLLKPTVFLPDFSCPLAALEDIACMKLSAVAQRGSRKDFIDIYALGQSGLTLTAMLDYYQLKYGVKDIAHVLYGLAYFDDAEREAAPYLLWKLEWLDVKGTIQTWLREFTYQ
jgi:Nucleotidyl transferase AbiEii toxin, Type IV TA system